MKHFKWATFLLTGALLTGCDDEERISFTPADGNASYSGNRALAGLDSTNYKIFLDLLYTPIPEKPSPALRGSLPINNIHIAQDDFQRSQGVFLNRLKQKFLSENRYAQRSIDEPALEECENGGSLHMKGELSDTHQNGKLNLNYQNCQIGSYIFSGNAYLLIFAIKDSFNEIGSATLSYNGLEASLTGSDEIMKLTGTVDDVFDFTPQSRRLTTLLNRKIVGSSEQSLSNIRSQFASLYDLTTLSGSLYDGLYGKVAVSTKQQLVYNGNDVPIAGEIVLSGANNSKVSILALGEQYNSEVDRSFLMLQIDVDADGDDQYESQELVSR